MLNNKRRFNINRKDVFMKIFESKKEKCDNCYKESIKTIRVSTKELNLCEKCFKEFKQIIKEKEKEEEV